MKEYWIKHSAQASIQEMLLDSNAEEISDNEMPEIVSILPSFKGKIILELGAGIGFVDLNFRIKISQKSRVIAVKN